MHHPLTERLQKLPRRLTSISNLRFYLGVSNKTCLNTSIHGFGIVIASNELLKLTPIVNRSDTDHSDNMRAALAGVLTIYEWLDLNCEADVKATIYNNEAYVYEHLKPNLEKWLRERQRPNLDLLMKIAPLMEKYPNIEFYRAEGSPEPRLFDDAQRLAAAAAGHRKK